MRRKRWNVFVFVGVFLQSILFTVDMSLGASPLWKRSDASGDAEQQLLQTLSVSAHLKDSQTSLFSHFEATGVEIRRMTTLPSILTNYFAVACT